MPKAGKKNHIFGDFFSEATKKNAKTGKEFGIEGKKVHFTNNMLSQIVKFIFLFGLILVLKWSVFEPSNFQVENDGLFGE